jgi:hypothetical protein
MKYPICTFMLSIALLLICQTGMAQANKKESFSINFGPEIAFTESAFRTTHRAGYGGSIKAEYTFGKHVSATINSGVLFFQGRGYFEPLAIQPKTYENLTAIPLKAGLRYYIGNFYVAGEAGAVFLNKYANTTRPAVSMGIGDKIKIGQGNIDISLRQEFWFGNPNNLNMAVLRVAYEIVW